MQALHGPSFKFSKIGAVSSSPVPRQYPEMLPLARNLPAVLVPRPASLIDPFPRPASVKILPGPGTFAFRPTEASPKPTPVQDRCRIRQTMLAVRWHLRREHLSIESFCYCLPLPLLGRPRFARM